MLYEELRDFYPQTNITFIVFGAKPFPNLRVQLRCWSMRHTGEGLLHHTSGMPGKMSLQDSEIGPWNR